MIKYNNKLIGVYYILSGGLSMPNLHGDWFHSRSSSNLSELITVRKIINESKKAVYQYMSWSGGRHGNPRLYELARAGDIQPSTMQTKVRAMIRFGFVKDESTCPLNWTPMGELWNNLYSLGNTTAAHEIYQLTLATSLALVAFSDDNLTLNPAEGELPLKHLFNSLDADGNIAMLDLQRMIDGNTERQGNNTSYWVKDLINSGLFVKREGGLHYTGRYPQFVEEVRNFVPNPSLTYQQWVEIRNNPLVGDSPFKESITSIFESIISDQHFEDQQVTTPLVEVIAEQQELSLPENDILNENTTFARSSRKVRSATWSKRIKRRYNNQCAVPECDIEGQPLVEAAHIKPDSVDNGDIPHRTHILNGLCLCKHCHTLFDNGYFTLTDNGRIMVSPQIIELPDHSAKLNVMDSDGLEIKQSRDGRLPLVEFIEHHRDYKYKQ